jgi:hypothetical protein
MKIKQRCDCKVETLESGGRGTPYSMKTTISYCPLHNAAPAMLEALRLIKTAILNCPMPLWKQLPLDFEKAATEIQAVIAKAEGN